MRRCVKCIWLTKLVFVCSLSVAAPFKAAAEDLFPLEITSAKWAHYGQCGSSSDNFFIFAGGFKGREILCASTDSRQDGKIYYLFMECSVNGSLATYMGTAHYSEWYIEVDMTEYRGATGAPDVYLELERCEE
jgi:hypothetical protein